MYQHIWKFISDKTGAINDPLGQLTVLADSDGRLILKFWDGRTDGRTLCVNIVISLLINSMENIKIGNIFFLHANYFSDDWLETKSTSLILK